MERERKILDGFEQMEPKIIMELKILGTEPYQHEEALSSNFQETKYLDWQGCERAKQATTWTKNWQTDTQISEFSAIFESEITITVLSRYVFKQIAKSSKRDQFVNNVKEILLNFRKSMYSSSPKELRTILSNFYGKSYSEFYTSLVLTSLKYLRQHSLKQFGKGNCRMEMWTSRTNQAQYTNLGREKDSKHFVSWKAVMTNSSCGYQVYVISVPYQSTKEVIQPERIQSVGENHEIK